MPLQDAFPPPTRTHEDRLSWASFLPANLAGLWDARGPAAPEICILFIYLFYFAPFESICLRSPPESDRVGVKRGPGTDLIPPLTKKLCRISSSPVQGEYLQVQGGLRQLL